MTTEMTKTGKVTSAVLAGVLGLGMVPAVGALAAVSPELGVEMGAVAEAVPADTVGNTVGVTKVGFYGTHTAASTAGFTTISSGSGIAAAQLTGDYDNWIYELEVTVTQNNENTYKFAQFYQGDDVLSFALSNGTWASSTDSSAVITNPTCTWVYSEDTGWTALKEWKADDTAFTSAQNLTITNIDVNVYTGTYGEDTLTTLNSGVAQDWPSASDLITLASATPTGTTSGQPKSSDGTLKDITATATLQTATVNNGTVKIDDAYDSYVVNSYNGEYGTLGFTSYDGEPYYANSYTAGTDTLTVIATPADEDAIGGTAALAGVWVVPGGGSPDPYFVSVSGTNTASIPTTNLTSGATLYGVWSYVADQPANPYGITFFDVPLPGAPNAQWYSKVVYEAADLGYMKGYQSNIFGPNDNIIRGDVAGTLFKMSGWPSDATYWADQVKNGQASPDSPWPDLTTVDHYFYSGLWAGNNGIIHGVDTADGAVFDGADNATREEMVTMFANYFDTARKAEGLTFSNPLNGSTAAPAWYTYNAQTNPLNGYTPMSYFTTDEYADAHVAQALEAFPDKDQVSDWAAPSVAWAIKNGYLMGFDINGTRYLQPQNNISRAEVAAMAVRIQPNDVVGTVYIGSASPLDVNYNAWNSNL